MLNLQAVPYLTPGEAGFRLDHLRDAWNLLRNDVWGHGLIAYKDVPNDLAMHVDERWAAWRMWYDDAARAPSNVMTPGHFGTEFVRNLDEWTEVYGHLQREVAAAVLASGSGRKLGAPGLVPVAKAGFDFGQALVFAGVGAFVLAGFWIWLRRPRG